MSETDIEIGVAEAVGQMLEDVGVDAAYVTAEGDDGGTVRLQISPELGRAPDRLRGGRFSGEGSDRTRDRFRLQVPAILPTDEVQSGDVAVGGRVVRLRVGDTFTVPGRRVSRPDRETVKVTVVGPVDHPALSGHWIAGGKL